MTSDSIWIIQNLFIYDFNIFMQNFSNLKIRD